MFERYTEEARRSLFFARYESSILGSISIEPEHLLLGILRQGQDVVDLISAPVANAIREQILRQTTGREPISTSVEIPFAKETKRALEEAAKQADDLAHAHIGSEHLLLALATTARTDTILKANGIAVSALREQVGGRRTAAVRQVDAAVALVRSIGEEHAQTPEAQRLVERICSDLAELRANITDAPG